MRTKFRLALAAVVVGALTVATAAPAGAQEEPATLGFAVDKTEAQPGALVLGKANADDVAEHCVTDLEAFQARFQELLAEPDGPILSLIPEFSPDEDVSDAENYEEMAFIATALVLIGIAFDVGGAAETALPQTFVMTFADIATQEPVGERDTFDPNTGEGSVVVPDIEPGLWAVAAACVGPSLDLEVIASAVRQSAVFLEEIGAPVVQPFTGQPDPEGYEEFLQEFLDSEATGQALRQEFLETIGPTLLEPMMVPDAFGAVLFCILDEQGNCPADEPPPPPPGEPIDVAPEAPAAAQPVVAAPTFTG